MSNINPTEPSPQRWQQRYLENDIPWDTGKPDTHLIKTISNLAIKPGKALEVGCGTGTNAIWLSQQGFDVLGVDVSPKAIEIAKSEASEAHTQCHFETIDFLDDLVSSAPFDFAYDRGCFHTYDEVATRSLFAKRLASVLSPDAIWHSLMGSTDGPPRDSGPPRRSATDIVTAIEPYFEVLKLEATRFDTDRHAHAHAWVLLAQRR